MRQKIEFDDIEGNAIKYDEESLGVPILYGIGWLITFAGQTPSPKIAGDYGYPKDAKNVPGGGQRANK